MQGYFEWDGWQWMVAIFIGVLLLALLGVWKLVELLLMFFHFMT